MKRLPLKITILGSGNVATQFATTFHAAGATIAEVYSPNAAHAKTLAKKVKANVVKSIADLSAADFILIAVKDDALTATVKALPAGKGIVVHTAGSVPMNVLQKFPQHGVLYPLQTISKKRTLKTEQLPLCIEASDKKTLAKLKQIAQLISGKVRLLDSDQRRAAHLAAVFACNFTNHLYAIAGQLLEEKNLPFDLLRPLILETAEKVQQLSPSEAQTGPALRNDRSVMNKHLALLKTHPEWKQLYRLFSKSIHDSAPKK